MKKLLVGLALLASMSSFAERVQQQQQQQIQCQTGSGNVAEIFKDVHVKYLEAQVDKKFNTEENTLIELSLVNKNPEELEKYEGVGSKLRYFRDASIVYTLGTALSFVFGGSCQVKSTWTTFGRSNYEAVNLYQVEYQKNNGKSCEQLVTIHSVYGAGDEWYGEPQVKFHNDTCSEKETEIYDIASQI